MTARHRPRHHSGGRTRATWSVGAIVLLAAIWGCSSLPRPDAREPASDPQARRLSELGRRHQLRGDLDRAEAFYVRALRVDAAFDRREGVVATLCALGRLRLAGRDLEAAEQRFAEALQITRGLGHPALAARARGGLGAVCLARGDANAAARWIEDALALPLDDPGRERAVLLHDLGRVRRLQGDDPAAADLLRCALAMHEAIGHRAGIATTSYSLAQLHADAGRLDQAHGHADRALQLDRALRDAPAVLQDLDLLRRIAGEVGDEDLALQYARRADRARSAAPGR